MIHLEPTPDVKRLASQTFPNYKGRKFKLDNSGHPVNVTSYWDGGSRDYYVALNLATGQTLPVPQNGTPFDGGPVAPNGVKVPQGYVIAEHSIFMGKDSGITFYVDPQSATQFLPTPVDLTDDERIALNATARLKNTYGGETDIRFRESRRDHGITRDRWNAAVARLKDAKLLNKAGAITTAGRNAIN
jgi:hypothetical protein